MSSESSEVGYRKGLTVKVIALIVVLGLAMFYMNFRMWWHMGVTLEPFFGGRIGAPIYLPFGFIWLLALVGLATKNKGLTVAEIAVLVGSLYVVMDSGFFSFFLEPLVWSHFASTNANLAKLLDYVPDVWAPKNPALVEKIYTGGGSIPGELMTPLFLHMVTFFFFMLMTLFTALSIKEQFVEVEKLPFPGVIPASEVLKMQEEGSLLSFAKQKWFYIGWVLGFLLAFYSTVNYFYPLFPVFFAWGQIYMTDLDKFLKGINPSIQEWWMFIPIDTMVFFLAPLDVSLSVSIWTGFKALIYPFIAIALGWIQPGQSTNAGPFKIVNFSLYHGTLAIGLWALLFRYDVWIKMFKSLTESVKEKLPEGKLDKRVIILGLIGSYLLNLILFASLGAHVGYLFLYLVFFFITTVGAARIWSETGQWPSGGPWEAAWLTVTVAHGTGVPNPWPSQTWWATKAAMRPTYHLPQATFYPWAIVSTYKLAEDTKTSERDLLGGQLIAIFLGAFISLYLGLSLLYSMGADNFFTRVWYIKALGARIASARDVAGVITAEGVMDQTQINNLIAAIVVFGILWFLRVKYAWFFFTPVAMFFYSGMWFLSSFVALIFKLIVLKIFGTQVYEKYAVPLVIGVIVGMSFGAFLFGSLATLVK